MKRFDAIKCISEEILGDGLVEALFLKGSIARNEDDEYSDVDMYAAVSTENWEKFLEKRLSYLEKYMPLLFWTESNFVGPQIVGVFENALHFDLYTVKVNAIPQTDEIRIIYDKNGLLASYKKESLSVSSEMIIDEINEFSFTLLEFETAYKRNDFIWAIRLFYAELHRVSLITRFIYDKENSRIGLKNLYKVIPNDFYIEINNILENATPSKILFAMKQLLKLTNKLIQELPDDIKNQVNNKFYNLMFTKIIGI